MADVTFGKNVIEHLTLAMYIDALVIYREYIQNSADAIDEAIASGLLTPEAAYIDITVDREKKCIAIRDNAGGIARRDFKRIMNSIASSQKDRSSNKGFRGIGRLGGVTYCKTLRFTSSAPGDDKASVFEWNGEELRKILNPNVPSGEELDAVQLVEKVTSSRTEDSTKEEHYFLVELVDVSDNNDVLLDCDMVREYLQTTAPVPYNQLSFRFAKDIKAKADELHFHIDEYNIRLNGEDITKIYEESLYDKPKEHGQREVYDRIEQLSFRELRDPQGVLLAWMWFGLSQFVKAIPENNLMRKIRLRMGNIQIGNEDALLSHKFYKESRGDQYFIGEIFIVSPELIPNARRDYFCENEAETHFAYALRNILYDDLYKLYHRASERKNQYRRQCEYQEAQVDYQERLETGAFTDSKEQKDLEGELNKKKKKAEEAAKKLERSNDNLDANLTNQNSDLDRDMQVVYGAITRANDAKTRNLRKTQKKAEEKRGKTPQGKQSSGHSLPEQLVKLTKGERELVDRIYRKLREILPPDLAKSAIEQLQEELRQ